MELHQAAFGGTFCNFEPLIVIRETVLIYEGMVRASTGRHTCMGMAVFSLFFPRGLGFGFTTWSGNVSGAFGFIIGAYGIGGLGHDTLIPPKKRLWFAGWTASMYACMDGSFPERLLKSTGHEGLGMKAFLNSQERDDRFEDIVKITNAHSTTFYK